MSDKLVEKEIERLKMKNNHLLERIDELEDALGFYADEETYRNCGDIGYYKQYRKIFHDQGITARKALETKK